MMLCKKPNSRFLCRNIGINSTRRYNQSLLALSSDASSFLHLNINKIRHYNSSVSTNLKEKIDEANNKSLEILTSGDVWLTDIRPAKEVIPALAGDQKRILLSGPPVGWENMAGAQKGAVAGAILFEGWAKTPEEAYKLGASGDIIFEPNHAYDSCGPMAGTVSPTFPIYVVENRTYGNTAFSRPADLSQQFGDFNDIKDIEWWRDGVAPYLSEGLQKSGPIDLMGILENTMEMGDESHNRNNAFTSLFANDMAIRMIEAGVPREKMLGVLNWLNYPTWNSSSGVRACLGLVMAAAKANIDPAKGIEYSTIVTCMARNGHEFGIKIGATGDDWYSYEAEIPEGKFFPPYKQEDAGRDMGDSAITEAYGWGSNVLAGALGFLKGLPADVERAWKITKENKKLMIGRHSRLKTPSFDFEGVPIGLDLRRIYTTGILPWINTGITHKDGGHRVVGRGLVRPPKQCFDEAINAFATKYGVNKDDVINTDEGPN